MIVKNRNLKKCKTFSIYKAIFHIPHVILVKKSTTKYAAYQHIHAKNCLLYRLLLLVCHEAPKYAKILH